MTSQANSSPQANTSLERQTPECFTSFTSSVGEIALPEKFTFPFCYQPHPLALLASQELQARLAQEYPIHMQPQGKMFGVLVVKNSKQELGYLIAISGSNSEIPANTQLASKLVPMVCSGFNDDSYFVTEQTRVNKLTAQISTLESCDNFIWLNTLLASEKASAEFQVGQWQQVMVANRAQRKAARKSLENAIALSTVGELEAKQQSIQFSRESVTDKKRLAELKDYWQQRLSKVEHQVAQLSEQIATLKKSRRKLSSKLQKLLFKQYQLSNIHGQKKNLVELFKTQASPIPPAGAGDCAAPKLLQYAFEHQLTPVTMAEFWWGKPAKSEIRKHGHFYPACQGKCQPILTHMLSGMTLDDNPLLENPGANKTLEIVYQDEHLVVVNKPHDLLSVPGVNIEDSVYTRVKALFPEAEGNLILHRLDMATSGLLVLSLTKRAHKHLQQQFIDKQVNKRYIALLDGELTQSEGTISLPLIVDINDRPRQKVCFDHGKPATTKWQVIKVKNNQTRVYLYPITGRTHQLRMHSAHPDGLDMAIVGDSLYGTPANRLHLHAEQLSFTHPVTKKPLCFEVDAAF